MQLVSPAFEDGAEIPEQYAYSSGDQCEGDNISPPLSWRGAPEGTVSFALIVVDPDGGNWVHWVVYNIPDSARSMESQVSGPARGSPGINSYGKLGWGGPCPPSGTHRYVFTLFALDKILDLDEGASLKDLETAMDEHILAQVSLTGLFSARQDQE
jgi:hypothetical protein